MIPLSLTLKGIYSYQDKEQVIDFTNLTGAGLFGIFGAVGSGKSTILEAISYALYGETERLNKRDDRGYNMMNLKSDQLLIDFIFKNGDNDQQYRFIAKAKRNSKQFTDVKTINREAYKKENENWIPVPVESAETITGLNYLNFRRTIIIPQGRFQEFLQLGDTDRTRMMKELFHLEKFDLSDKVKALEDKNNERLTHLQGQLVQLADIKTERIKELENALNELKLEINLNQTALKEKQLVVENLRQLKELFEKLEKEKKDYAALTEQKPYFEKIRQQVNSYQACILKFKNLIDRITESGTKKEKLNNELQQNKKNLTEISANLENLLAGFEVLKVRFNNKENLKKQVDDLEKTLQLQRISIETAQLNERWQNGLKTQVEIENKLKKSEEFIAELKNKINALKLNQTDFSMLLEIKNWFNQLNSIKKELENLENERQQVIHKLNELETAIKDYSQKLGFTEKTIHETDLKNRISTLKSEFEHCIEQAEEELRHLKVKLELSRYSENLKEGEECPVCGSMHHPLKMKAHDLSDENNILAEKLANLKSDLKNLLQLEKNTDNKMVEIQSVKERLLALNSKIENAATSLKNHQSAYNFKKNYTIEELEQAMFEAKKEQSELQELEKKQTENEDLLKLDYSKKEKYQEAINKISNELHSQKATYDTLYRQINFTGLDEKLLLSNDELQKEISNLNKEYLQLINDYEAAEKKINALKPEKDKLNGTIEAGESVLLQLVQEISNLTQKFNDELIQSGYSSPEQVKQILASNLDIEKENQRIMDFENNYYSVGLTLDKLRSQAEGKNFKSEEYLSQVEELTKITELIDFHNKKLGSMENELLELKNKIKEKENLQNELNQLNLRAENIKTLKNLFKGSGFVNFVSSVYLQNLINIANQRFKALTQQKLSLELTETNDFIIRDYLNEGKTRSVKTLSGGQTFQASLSLALALADNIQSVTKSNHNFFFLDEGFGSLDKESLSIVFQSLKSLRKENRIVGVISHVEEMQQEIDNYLKIENSPENGSLIFKSWEM
ncbi:MAG: AAA family ATPase [Bacteroidales bacterium]